jgi:hypothetical protein
MGVLRYTVDNAKGIRGRGGEGGAVMVRLGFRGRGEGDHSRVS